jgi:hypothetical protein
MKAYITRDLLRDTKPGDKVMDIADTVVQGFIVRVTLGGAMVYGIRYTAGSGVQVRYSLNKSFPTTSVSDAREEARILLGKVAAGENPAQEKKAKAVGRLTLGDFIDGDYGDHLQSKTKTADATVLRLKKCFAKFLGTALKDIDALAIERWRAARIKAGISASTVNRDIGALKPLFSRAVEWKKLQENPLKGFKPLDDDADPIVRFLSAEEEARLRVALDKREKRDRGKRTTAPRCRLDFQSVWF